MGLSSKNKRTMSALLIILFTLFVVYPIATALGSAFIALFVHPLWDWIMPEIFGLPEITYWQAFGLCWLSSIFFKSYNHQNHQKND